MAVPVAAIVTGSNSSDSDNATVMAALCDYGNSSSRSSTHPSTSSVCKWCVEPSLCASTIRKKPVSFLYARKCPVANHSDRAPTGYTNTTPAHIQY